MKVISVHVPKSAGSTFGNLLTSIYGEARVLKDYADLPMNPLSPYNVDHESWRASASAEVRSIPPEFDAVHGHFAVEKYNEVFPEARRIAWVRHPASWVISLYFFWMHRPRDHSITTHPLIRRLHAEGLSLLEFARDPSVRDRISRVFLRGYPLDSFFFLGVQENFRDDLRDLAAMMGWHGVEAGFENRSPEPGYAGRLREIEEDRRLIDRLIALNEGDMALYEEVVRLRSRRIQEDRARAGRDARLVAFPARAEGEPDDRSSRVA